MGGVTRRVKMAPAKPCAACRAHPLGAERATCRVFSMSECRKQCSVLYSIAKPDEGLDRAETSQLSCVVQCRDCEVWL